MALPSLDITSLSNLPPDWHLFKFFLGPYKQCKEWHFLYEDGNQYSFCITIEPIEDAYPPQFQFSYYPSSLIFNKNQPPAYTTIL